MHSSIDILVEPAAWTRNVPTLHKTGLAVQEAIESAVVTEGDVVRQAQGGDSLAFEQLYEEHVNRVYALCLRMVSDQRRAEELTQDTFVKIWEALPSFRFQSSFGTWVHRIAVNIVLAELRSEKRRAHKVDHLDEFQMEAKQAMPETSLDLEAAIARLPEGAREVLILHDIEGYRYREIAELAGMAEGTVKSQLHRARKLVREALLA